MGTCDGQLGWKGRWHPSRQSQSDQHAQENTPVSCCCCTCSSIELNSTNSPRSRTNVDLSPNLSTNLQWAPLFSHVNTYIPCEWGICMWSKLQPAPSLPPSLADYRNLFLCFPFRPTLCLVQRALWLNVLDVRAIRRHVRHACLWCFNCIIMHVSKQWKESGRTSGQARAEVHRVVQLWCAHTKHTVVMIVIVLLMI